MNARADIIMLDTSVLRDIARGNSQAAEALIRRIKSGARVYVSRLAYRELVLDAPTPELRQQWRLLLKDAKIKIAPKVKTAPNAGPESKSAFSHRVDVYEANVKNQEFKMSAKEKKQWKEKNWKLNETRPAGGVEQYKRSPGLKEDFTKPGDLFVAAEAKGTQAKLWTFDNDMRIRGARAGVEIANESTLKVVGTGKDNPALAREKLGIKEPILRKLKINIKTRAIRLGRSIRGGAPRLGGIVLGMGIQIGLHFLEKWTTEQTLQRKIKKELEALQPTIDDKMNALKPKIALLQLQDRLGRQLFIQVTVEVHSVTKSVRLRSYTDVEVHLGGVTLSDGNVNEERTYKEGGRTINEVTQSIEAEVYTPEELAMFWDLAEQYAEHKNAVKADPSDKIDKRELASVRAEIVELFGPEIWFFDAEERAYLSRYQ